MERVPEGHHHHVDLVALALLLAQRELLDVPVLHRLVAQVVAEADVEALRGAAREELRLVGVPPSATP